MWSRKDFENTLAAVLKGDWLAHRKLIHYFNLENRSFKKADPEKEEQKRICFETTLQAANNNNAEAVAFMGVLYRDGFGVEKNLETSLQYINSANNQYHNTTGLYLLGWCNYWGVGLQKNTTKGLELLRQAAEHGHVGAAAELGLVLDAGDEKARWRNFATEQGDPNALNAAMGFPVMRGNPFGLYIPQNKDITITWKDVKEVDRVLGNGEVLYNTTGYEVTIAYTGSINIGEIPKKTLDYPYAQSYKEAADFAKYSNTNICVFGTISVIALPLSAIIHGLVCACGGCTCDLVKESYQDSDDRARIANSIASVVWERSVSEMIREADNLITKRLAQVGSGVANQSQLFRSGYQAGHNPMPSAPQQYGENMPFLSDQKEPNAPPPYSPVVPIYQPLEIEERKERVVHVQGGASLRMGGSRK